MLIPRSEIDRFLARAVEYNPEGKATSDAGDAGQNGGETGRLRKKSRALFTPGYIKRTTAECIACYAHFNDHSALCAGRLNNAVQEWRRRVSWLSGISNERDSFSGAHEHAVHSTTYASGVIAASISWTSA